MEAARAHREGEIGAVVDDEQRARLPAAIAETKGKRVKLGKGRALVPELNQAAAAREHRVEQRGQRATPADLGIEDDIDGGGQPHPEVSSRDAARTGEWRTPRRETSGRRGASSERESWS